MEKTHWLFVKGTQGDANFRVGLQKYVIPAPLYCNIKNNGGLRVKGFFKMLLKLWHLECFLYHIYIADANVNQIRPTSPHSQGSF